MKKIIYLALALGAMVPTLNSCRDSALEPTLAQDKDLSNSLSTASDLRNLLNGAYNRMSLYEYYGRNFIVFGEVRSDNAFSSAATNRFVEVGQLSLLNTTTDVSYAWTRLNTVLAPVNIVINAANISGDTAEVNQYKGEAYALRALVHFDLLKLFGQQDVTGQGGMSALGVPYVKTFGTVASPARNTVQEVYDNIMTDLDTAISLMTSAQDDTSKHYMTSNAAKALKARVALHFKQYAVAAQYAKEVIDSGVYSVATSSSFASTFNTDSTSNQIFSIANSTTDNVSANSLANIYDAADYGDIEFLADLYSTYETADVRRSLLTLSEKATSNNRYRITKFKDSANSGSFDVPVIRYEEVVLIYAEALLQQGDAATALTYLNQIANNRGATAYTVATLDNILLERRKEFAGEGFRFYDLVRTGKDLPLVDNVLQTYGTVTYGSYKLAFPIPLGELTANSNMKQNYGY